MLRNKGTAGGGGSARGGASPSTVPGTRYGLTGTPEINSKLMKSERERSSPKRRIENIINNNNAYASTSGGPRVKEPKPSLEEASDTESEETDLSGSEGDDTSWISWFCGLKGNEFFCEIDEDYIHDDFNLCGLNGQVPYYDYALDMILDNDALSGDIDSEEQNEMVESAAELLYGLIHVRYILTSKGLNAMLEKYKRVDFGRCPRVYCGGQPCLPASQSDIPRQGTVKIYCPKCEDLFYPRSKYQCNIDGAYFGTTFPHLFMMTYPTVKPMKPVQTYVPRVYGFKLHKSAR
uniref:Casein kinase II subunit beta n=1 Tax=Araucaria cunninghamii TaxID=56994 RepID=A0A0D6R860_ARACU